MNTKTYLAVIALLTASLTAQVAPALTPPKSTSGGDEAVALEKFLVVGQPIEGYRATDALTGTKTGAALRDLPLSLAVIPRQLIEDRRITFLAEALDNVSGAQRKLGYGGVQNFGAIIRGFDSGFVTLRNGYRDFGFYTLRDTANVERFEVLKGPGSILYGSLQPGGITNTLTKQPLATPLRRATVIVGGHDFYRGELDVGGPLAKNVFYRANLAYENAGSFRDRVENESEFIAPAVTWVLGPDTRWTVELEYKHSNYTWDLGLPRNPLSFTVPTSRFLGEPDAKNDAQSFLASSVLEHRFNAGWKLRQNLETAYSGGDYNLRSPLSIGANGRTVSRIAYATKERSINYNLQHELVGQFSTGDVKHQAIVGVELLRAEDGYDFLFQSLASIDLLAPVYGAQPGAGFPLFGNTTKRDGAALYAQDLIALRDDVKLLVGARYDTVYYDDYDRVRKATNRIATDAAVSPQTGLVYQPARATSLYASYSTSFLPIAGGRTFNGSFLEPEKGEQFETGVKQEFFNGRASATLAAYWITKENVSTPDLVNTGFRLQVGEQKSNGVELDLAGSPVRGWDIIVAGAYNDAYVSRDNRFAVGSFLPGAPKLSGSVWSKYALQSGAAKGLGFGLGAFSASKRQTVLPNNVWLPSYTRFDAALYYAPGAWSLQLNVKNLADDRIYDLTGTTVMPQVPRTFLLSASYTF